MSLDRLMGAPDPDELDRAFAEAMAADPGRGPGEVGALRRAWRRRRRELGGRAPDGGSHPPPVTPPLEREPLPAAVRRAPRLDAEQQKWGCGGLLAVWAVVAATRACIRMVDRAEEDTDRRQQDQQVEVDDPFRQRPSGRMRSPEEADAMRRQVDRLLLDADTTAQEFRGLVRTLAGTELALRRAVEMGSVTGRDGKRLRALLRRIER